MQPIRVCQLITELGNGGAERCLFELARRLDRRRFDVRVAALQGGPYAELLEKEGVKVTVLGVRGAWDIGKLRTMARLLRDERIDLLHSHLFHSDLVGRPAAMLAGTPHYVHTLHSAQSFFGWRHYAFARLLAGRCEKLICVSQSVRDFHSRKTGLPLERYHVIHNGIDTAFFECSTESRNILRTQWGVTNGDAVVAFVGRLIEEKGVDVLLEAIRLLKGKSIQFVIAGEGPLRGRIEEFLKTPAGSRGRMMGQTGDVRGVLSAADIFVMPSRCEGFGLAAAEAMAAGLPVIASRIPSLQEIINDDNCGLLIDPENADQFAEKIDALARDESLRQRLGQAAREKIVSRYSIAENIKAHEELYQSLVAAT